MRIISLIIKSLRRDFVSVMILFVICFYLIQGGLVVIRGIDQLTYLTRLSSAAGLDDKIIYTAAYEYSTREIQEEANIIGKVSGVEKAEMVKTYSGLLNDQFGFIFISYDISALENLRYPLSEGQYPQIDESNRIILPPVYRDFFSVGETINLWMQNFEMRLNDEEPIPVTVVVAGFLQDNLMISFRYTAPNMTLSDLYSGEPLTGIVYGLNDNDGNPVKHGLSHAVIITAEQGTRLDVLKEDIISVVRSKSFVHTGPEIVERYWTSNTKIVQKQAIMTVSLFFLAFSTLIAGTYFSLIYRQKEMAVHYISGATWEECIVAMVAPKIIAIFLGYLLAVYQYRTKSIYGEDLVFGISAQMRDSYVLIVFAIIFVLFLLGVLPFYIMTLKKSPMELFRKD